MIGKMLDDNLLPETINSNIHLLEMLLKKLADYLPTIISALVLLLAGLIIRKITLSLLKNAISKSKLDKTIHGFVISASDAVITALVAIITLSSLGIPMTSIIAVFSAAGLAIGLALQNSLSNVAGGFIILLSKPFKAGDYISAAGNEGTVEEITLLSTKIITADNKAVFIPNGMLSGAAITNYTREERRRVDLTFGISYDDDFKEAAEIIKKIISLHPKTLTSPPPMVRVIKLGESSVDIVTRVWTACADYWDVYFDLTEQVKTAFDENGITIPYNHINVHNFDGKEVK